MAYLIDTDILIYYVNGVLEANQLLDELADEGLSTSVISYMEALQGLPRSPIPHEAQFRFDALIDRIPVIAFSTQEAQQCAELRESLRQQGRRVRPRALDLLIAATAIEHGLTLITNNQADYADIHDLTIEVVRTFPFS